MAYNEALAERIREKIGGRPDVVEKKMFGGVGFLVNGNMAVGINKESLIVRIDKNDHDEALADPAARTFDITGKPMKGWIMVSPDGYASEASFADWLDRGLAFAVSLPAK